MFFSKQDQIGRYWKVDVHEQSWFPVKQKIMPWQEHAEIYKHVEQNSWLRPFLLDMDLSVLRRLEVFEV